MSGWSKRVNRSKTDLTHRHADGTRQKYGTAAEFVDGIESGDRGEDVHYGRDDTDDERVLDAAVGEEGGSVVEDEIDTGHWVKGLKD